MGRYMDHTKGMVEAGMRGQDRYTKGAAGSYWCTWYLTISTWMPKAHPRQGASGRTYTAGLSMDTVRVSIRCLCKEGLAWAGRLGKDGSFPFQVMEDGSVGQTGPEGRRGI